MKYGATRKFSHFRCVKMSGSRMVLNMIIFNKPLYLYHSIIVWMTGIKKRDNCITYEVMFELDSLTQLNMNFRIGF